MNEEWSICVDFPCTLAFQKERVSGNTNRDDMEWTKQAWLYFNQLYYLDTSGSNSALQPGKVQIPLPPENGRRSNARGLPRDVKIVTGRFANSSFANVSGQFANVSGKLANVSGQFANVSGQFANV